MKATLSTEKNKGFKALGFLITTGYFCCVVSIVFAIAVMTKDLMGGTLMFLGSVFSVLVLYVIHKIGNAVFLIRDDILSRVVKSENVL